MTSENVLPNYYKELNEAIKIAGQIRRSSLLVNDDSNNWRILVINDRLKLYKDVMDLNLPEAEGFVHINDSFGHISRVKVQLNIENVRFLADIIRTYNGYNNPLNQKLPDIAQRLKKLISIDQKQEVREEPQETPKPQTKSGLYSVNNKEFLVYYKRFYSDNLKVEQEVADTEVSGFIIYLELKNKDSIGVAEPILKKYQVPVDELYSHISQNRSVGLKFKLKDRVFQRLKEKIFSFSSPDDIFDLKNPLGKYVLCDLINYDLLELELL